MFSKKFFILLETVAFEEPSSASKILVISSTVFYFNNSEFRSSFKCSLILLLSSDVQIGSSFTTSPSLVSSFLSSSSFNFSSSLSSEVFTNLSSFPSFIVYSSLIMILPLSALADLNGTPSNNFWKYS
jgi:hypothetical protein